MKLYFIRHGKTEVVDGNFFRSHLSNEGILQSKNALELLPKPDIIITSPFYRAIDTAQIFCDHYNLKYEIADYLGEWKLQTQNLPDEEYFPEEKKGWKDQDYIVKGNESLNQLKERAYNGLLETITKYEGKNIDNIFLFAHGTIIDMLCSKLNNRQARIDDIRNMKYLDYAIVEYTDKLNNVKVNINNIKLIKDIIDKN